METMEQFRAALSPEERLLLACARRVACDDPSLSVLSISSLMIDWDRLVALSVRHRVTPLLYEYLRHVCPEIILDKVLATLHADTVATTYANLRMTHELIRLANLFATHGIVTVPFKGPVLAIEAYGKLGLRQFGDLDLLLHKKDIARAKRLLITEGYRPLIELTDEQEADLIKYEDDYAFINADQSIKIELHGGIKPKFYAFVIDEDGLWERLTPILIGGRQFLHFAPEDQILTLCIHGASHSWERLFWICDIAELLKTHQHIDWQELLYRARVLGAKRAVLLGLGLAQELLNAPLSSIVTQAIKADPTVIRLVTQVAWRLFEETAETVEGFEQFRFFFHVRERWRDRLRYGFHLALDPTIHDWNVMTLPRSISFLYYVVRPIRLLRDYVVRPLSRLVSTPFRYMGF